MRVKDGNSYVLVGSQGGAPTHPAWVHNLRVNPDVEIRDETVVRPMRVREVADEAERARLWKLAVAASRLTRNTKSALPGGFRSLLQSGLSEGLGLLFGPEDPNNRNVAAQLRLHRRRLRAPDAQGAGQVGRAAARRMRERRPGRCGAEQGRRRRLFLRRRRAGPGAAGDGRLPGPALRHVDSTDTGGSSYLIHVGHAAQAIAAGKCSVALITLAGRPRSEGMATGTRRALGDRRARRAVGDALRAGTANIYAMVAMRHMHEFGTTSEQLAWIKVAASHHAQHNPHAMLREVVTVEDVLDSPMVADPLHRLDCCVDHRRRRRADRRRAPEIARVARSGRWSTCSAPARPSRASTGGDVDLTYTAPPGRARAPSRRPA